MNTRLLGNFKTFNSTVIFVLWHLLPLARSYFKFWKAKLCVLLSHCKMISRGRERSVRGVRMGKSGPLERVELANQVQGFRIPDRSEA